MHTLWQRYNAASYLNTTRKDIYGKRSLWYDKDHKLSRKRIYLTRKYDIDKLPWLSYVKIKKYRFVLIQKVTKNLNDIVIKKYCQQ